MRIVNDVIEINGSLSADYVSTVIPIPQSFGIAVQAVWTGTPNGSIFLQASNDQSNWSDLPGAVSIAGAAGSNLWNIDSPAYPWIRLKFTYSSSSGTITKISFNAKGF